MWYPDNYWGQKLSEYTEGPRPGTSTISSRQGGWVAFGPIWHEPCLPPYWHEPCLNGLLARVLPSSPAGPSPFHVKQTRWSSDCPSSPLQAVDPPPPPSTPHSRSHVCVRPDETPTPPTPPPRIVLDSPVCPSILPRPPPPEKREIGGVVGVVGVSGRR